jgi:hypothetical protein
MFIYDIEKNYNMSPYYKSGDYICINDDRIGTNVSFKLHEENGNIYAYFKETSKYNYQSIYNRNKTTIITSLEDFQNKWYNFYNNINN